MLSVAEALAHPQALERGVVREGEDGFIRADYPALFDGERPRIADGSAVPALGEQTETVLAEHGWTSGGSRRAARRAGVGAHGGFWRRLWAALRL